MLNRLRFAPVLTFLALTGCSPDIEIEVVSAVQSTGAIRSAPPGDGHVYLQVQVRVANAGSDSIQIGPQVFYAQTSDGVEALASVVTVELPGGCQADERLAAGRSLECVLLFNLTRGAATELLIYDDGEDRVETPLESEPCGTCG